MNNNATKKKLALNKTSLRDLTTSELEMVGGASGGETATCPGNCYTYTCSSDCPTVQTCGNCGYTNPCSSWPITNTCGCTYGCVTDGCSNTSVCNK